MDQAVRPTITILPAQHGTITPEDGDTSETPS